MRCTSKVTILFGNEKFEEGDIVKVIARKDFEKTYIGKIISVFTDAISLDYSQKKSWRS